MKTIGTTVAAMALAAVVGTGCIAVNMEGQDGARRTCCPKMCAKKLIAARITVKADKIEAFVEAVKPLIAASRAEPGCISYTLYQNPHERTFFFFFEEWKNQAAIDFHFATPHFKAFGDQIKDMTAGPPEITILDACVPPAAK